MKKKKIADNDQREQDTERNVQKSETESDKERKSVSYVYSKKFLDLSLPKPLFRQQRTLPSVIQVTSQPVSLCKLVSTEYLPSNGSRPLINVRQRIVNSILFFQCVSSLLIDGNVFETAPPPRLRPDRTYLFYRFQTYFVKIVICH